jgi:hypothetical protein
LLTGPTVVVSGRRVEQLGMDGASVTASAILESSKMTYEKVVVYRFKALTCISTGRPLRSNR